MPNEQNEISQEIAAKKKKKAGYYYRRKKNTAAVGDAASKPAEQIEKALSAQKRSEAPQQKPPVQQKKSTAAGSQNQNPGQGQKRRGKKPAQQTSGELAHKLRIIPLGGIEEIGKNMTVIEYGDDMIVIDAGMAFPGGDMPGIDLVIPDITYITKNFNKLRGIVLTHGHEDHIGALPYILRHLKVPVYGTRLTLGIIRSRLVEHKLADKVTLVQVSPGDTIKLGAIKAEFIHVNHSIPDAVSIVLTTPVGVVLFTGDFKIDSTPIQGSMIDLARFGELGNAGVLAMFSDSTNAERPGWTPSEKKVGFAFENLFKNNDKRIVIATFSSNTHRVQQIIDAAVQFNRKVVISGRSMENYVKVAAELGVIDVPDGVLIDIGMMHRYTKDRIVLITTGSQGEPTSALSRMASSDHRKVEIGPDDMVILSATPIPGNEKTVSKVVNDLLKLGAEVIYDNIYDIHVSGHACQEELKLLLQLVKPKFFIPVHGEYKHLYKHTQLAYSIGYTPDKVLIPGIGKVMEFSPDDVEWNGTVPAGAVLIDGLGVGDVGNIVLKERKKLSDDGLLVVVAGVEKATGQIVSGPEIVSRGFVFMRESEALIDGAKQLSKQVLEKHMGKTVLNWNAIKNELRDELSDYVYEKTRRSPMILPIVMEL